MSTEGKTLEQVKKEDEVIRREMEHGERFLRAWACRWKDDDLRDIFYFVDGTPNALWHILIKEFDRRRISVDKKGRGTKTILKKEVRKK